MIKYRLTKNKNIAFNDYICIYHFNNFTKPKMFLQYYFFLLLHLNQCTLHITFTNHWEDSALAKCTVKLIKRVFIDECTITFVFDNQRYIFLPKNITNPQILILADGSLQLELPIYNNYFIYSENSTSLNSTLTKLQNLTIWDQSISPRGKFLIITSAKSDLKIFFQVLFGFAITNVILVVYGKGSNFETIKLYSSNLFDTDSNCGKIPTPYLISHCDQNKNLIFNEIITNLNGCEIKLLSKYDIDVTFKEAAADATFRKLVDIMSEILNGTTHIVVDQNQHEALYNQSAGIILNIAYSMSDTITKEYELSNIIYLEELTYAVPKPLPISNVQVIVSVFERNVWIAFCIAFITMICVRMVDKRQSLLATKWFY